MDEIVQFVKWLKESSHIVFFGGAGVSTESGIPDFRSIDGLYHQQYDFPPETILSHSFFKKNPEEFFRFYKNKMIAAQALPNHAHLALAELERMGKLKAVITQNIDGLHQAAGSQTVLELHGSVKRNYCVGCGAFYGVSEVCNAAGIPRCSCGGIIKPDVVLYEEGLDNEMMRSAIRYISQSDLLIVGGTSLTVYPAAGLIDYYKGSKLVLINREKIVMDNRADLIFKQKIGEVFDMVMKELKV